MGQRQRLKRGPSTPVRPGRSRTDVSIRMQRERGRTRPIFLQRNSNSTAVPSEVSSDGRGLDDAAAIDCSSSRRGYCPFFQTKFRENAIASRTAASRRRRRLGRLYPIRRASLSLSAQLRLPASDIINRTGFSFVQSQFDTGSSGTTRLGKEQTKETVADSSSGSGEHERFVRPPISSRRFSPSLYAPHSTQSPQSLSSSRLSDRYSSRTLVPKSDFFLAPPRSSRRFRNQCASFLHRLLDIDAHRR